MQQWCTKQEVENEPAAKQHSMHAVLIILASHYVVGLMVTANWFDFDMSLPQQFPPHANKDARV